MRQFFQQTFASLIGTLAGLFLFFVLGTSTMVVLLISAASSSDAIKVKDKSYLIFDLSTQISDTDPSSDLGQIFSGENSKSITLRQLIQSLDKATKDERISGLFLDGRIAAGTNDYATLTEIRVALERFRAAGKKIIAYDVDFSEKEYYLASLADSIILNPTGTIEINGLSSEQVFLTGAMEKYGIEVQTVRAGNYKAAVEPLTRKNLSPENREQLEALLKDLWGEFITKVAQSRKLTPQKLQAIADSKGFINAQEALSLGLVDRVAYLDEIIKELEEVTGSNKEERSFHQIQLGAYASVPVKNVQNTFSSNKIAVVYAEGTIVNGESDFEQIGGDSLAKELRKLRQDNDVKAVVMRINSPGGSASASEIIRREMELIGQNKPLIVSMGNYAASGGYWLSTAAERIFAQPNTITGSIGVFGLFTNIQKLGNNNGIAWDTVDTGTLANFDTISRPKTPQELAIYQKFVNQIYDTFLDKVAKSRNMPKAKVASIAQGRVWSGEDAKQIGLVDEIGGLDAAIAYAAEKAKLGKDWEIQEYPKSLGFQAEILKRLLTKTQTQLQSDRLSAEFLKFKKEVEFWQSLSDPKGVYTILPFSLKIK